MAALLDQGSSLQDDKAGSKYKENETSKSFIPGSNSRDAGRKFPYKIIAIIAGAIILVIVLITTIVLSVTSSSSPPMKKGLTRVPWNEISFNPHDPSSYEDEVSTLNSFMLKYNETKLGGKMVSCDVDKPVPEGKLCYFDLNWIYSICPPYLDWKYRTEHPCVLLTLNEVTDHIQVYDTLEELPESIPSELYDYIFDKYNENGKKMPKNIWLSCTNKEGYTFLPWSIPANYLSYNDDPDYLSPLVGVALNLEGKANMEEEIECKLWAKNITHETDDFATVEFKVLMTGA